MSDLLSSKERVALEEEIARLKRDNIKLQRQIRITNEAQDRINSLFSVKKNINEMVSLEQKSKNVICKCF